MPTPLHETLGSEFAGDGSRPAPDAARRGMSASLTTRLPGEPQEGAPPAAALIDPAALGRLVSQFSGLDLSSIDASVSRLGAGTDLRASLPAVDGLLAPIQPWLRTLELLRSDGGLALLARLRSGATEGPRLGLAGLESAWSELLTTSQSAGVGDLLATLGPLLPAPLAASGPLNRAADVALAARDLIGLLAGMMRMQTSAEDVRDRAELIAGLLSPETLTTLLARARTWVDSPALVAVLEGVTDPNDAAQVDAAERALRELTSALSELIELAVRGMAFGEASLVHADPAAAVVSLESAAAELRALDPGRIRGASSALAALLARLTPALPGSPAPDFETAWAAVSDLVTRLRDMIAALDTAPLTRPVSQVLGTMTGVTAQINRVFAEVSGAIRGAFAAARALVEELNLRAVADAIERFIQPLASALHQLDVLLGAAIAAIESGAQALADAIADVTRALETGAGAIASAFDALNAALTGLQLDAMVEALQSGIGSVAAELERIQLRPYFDAAADAMNSGTDVISAVPLSLLPDSMKRELSGVIQPIRAIDFERDVVTPLKTQLDTILDRVDTELLGDVQQAFDQLAGFLSDNDPRGWVAELDGELEAFVARVRELDPRASLRPALEAVAQIRAEIGSFNLSARVLGPIREVFGTILDGFDALDPSPLLEPIERQVGQAREQIVETIQLDVWASKVDELYEVVDGFLARVDPNVLGARLDRVIDVALAARRERPATSIAGTLIASLLASSGLSVRPNAFLAASRWITGDDGAAEVRALVAGGAAAMRRARDAVASIDLSRMASELDSGFRRIRAALERHPAGSLLRLRLDPVLAALSPLDSLGAQRASQLRYLALLEQSSARLNALESSGMSELTASAEGLRAALRPLSPVRASILALPRRFGVDITGQDLREALATIVVALRPSRILSTLEPIVAALRDKLRATLREGLVVPVKAAFAELQALLANLDVSIFRRELSTLHAEIRAQIAAFDPAVLLAEPLAALAQLQADVAAFDPLAPIETVLDALDTAIDALSARFKPSLLLAGALLAYEQVLDLTRALDVRELLGPILAALRELETQLGSGLDETVVAFERLQGALGSVNGELSGAISAGGSA